MNLGAIWGPLPRGAQWRQRTRDTSAAQAPFRNSPRSFQPCQPRREGWAVKPRAGADLCYPYPLAENRKGKEGQPLVSAVACAGDAEKAARCTEDGCCITPGGPGILLLGPPGSVVSLGVNFFLFPIVYLILQTVNSSVRCLSVIGYLHRAQENRS